MNSKVEIIKVWFMVVLGWFSCIIKDSLPMLVLTFFQDHISLRPPPISWLWTPLNERVVSENDCYLPSNGFENNCSKIRFKVQKYTVSSNRNGPFCNFASIHFLAIWQMIEVETLQFTKLISRKIYKEISGFLCHSDFTWNQFWRT